MSYYQKLFDYMLKEHGVTMLETDMQEVCNIVNNMQQVKNDCNHVWDVDMYDRDGFAVSKYCIYCRKREFV